jgi:hypothetical protein
MTPIRPDAFRVHGVVPKFLASGMRVSAFGSPVTLRQKYQDVTVVIPAGKSAIGRGYCYLCGDGAEVVLEAP